MDKLSKQQRHNNMAAIRSKNTKPEMIVRRGLWKRGFRYRLNHKRLPGHPDLVLRKYRTCIFVNGCFWYGHFDDDLWVLLQSKVWRQKLRDYIVEHKLTDGFWNGKMVAEGLGVLTAILLTA